jgi:hypothetical protein
MGAILCVRRGQAYFFAMLTHLRLSVRTDAQIREHFCRAKQNVSGFAVLSIVADRIAGIKFALRQEFARARKASPLTANRGQIDSSSLGFIQDVFACARAYHSLAVGRHQRNVE